MKPENFAAKYLSSFAIAKLLLEHNVSRSRVPGKLLSDRGEEINLWGLQTDGYKEG